MKKSLGLLQLTFASTSAIIGSGWLLGISGSSRYAGPASILSWFFSGLAIMLLALVYSEIGAMLPTAGGLARYPKYTHGAFLGFITSWILIIAGSAVSTIEAEATVQYINSSCGGVFFSGGALTAEGLIFAFIILLAFFLLNLFGAKIFAGTNTFLTYFKLIILFTTGASLIYVSIKNGGIGRMMSYKPMPYGYEGIMKSMSAGGVIFSYLGFRQAIDLSGEARNPGRDVPLATLLSVMVGIIAFTVLATGFILAVPGIRNNNWNMIRMSSPFVQLLNFYGLPAFAMMVIAGAVISPFATGLVYLGTTSRVSYAMSVMRFLPKSFHRNFNRHGTAYLPLLFTFLLSAAYLLPFPSWHSLVGVITSGIVFTYIMGPVGLMAFRKLDPKRERPFYLPLANIISPLAFIVGTLIIYWSGFAVLWKLGIGILAGIFVFIISTTGNSWEKFKSSVVPGLWFLFYVCSILVLSYAGSSNFGGINIIKKPFDIIAAATVAVVFYYIALKNSLGGDEMKMIIEEEFISEEIELNN